jgi:hypothetical protein
MREWRTRMLFVYDNLDTLFMKAKASPLNEEPRRSLPPEAPLYWCTIHSRVWHLAQREIVNRKVPMID